VFGISRIALNFKLKVSVGTEHCKTIAGKNKVFLPYC
jgi:hypothetical protein